MSTPITAEALRRAPKVLLHDHLDGGLRPATVVELARRTGYGELPSTDAPGLGAWFRVAAECAEDLGADGVVYAEVRFAPELHLERGLSLDQVVEAVLAGFADGAGRAAAAGFPIRVGALLTAMRHNARSMEIAELVVRYRDTGVVGFDIAGAEAGHPPTRHLDAFEYLQRENAHFTIHAG